MNTDDEQKREQGTCEYLKEHPSVLISCISGLVLIISFVFNVLIYANECKYFEYWHLDKRLIEMNYQNQIYEMVTISILYVAIMLVQCFCSLTLTQYQNRIQVIIFGKLLLKRLKKEFKPVSPKKKNTQNETAATESDNLEENTIFYIDKYKKSAEDFSKNVLKKNLFDVFTALVLSILMLGIVNYLFMSMSVTGVKWKEFFIQIAIFSILIWGLSYMGIIMVQLLFNFRYRKLSLEEQVERFERLLDRYKEDKTEYPLKILLEFKVREHIKRESVYSFIVYATVIFVTFVGMINSRKENEIDNIDSFNIVEYANKEYAIIYRDSSYLYLEEVKIIGNEIFVYVDKQRRIAEADVEMINREFDDVSRIDINGKLL